MASANARTTGVRTREQQDRERANELLLEGKAGGGRLNVAKQTDNRPM
jgi:hypothetical protein